MKQIKLNKENAVSPVVGVMLMLVVTIVIAAVVAAFVGGMTISESAAPNSYFEVGYNAAISDLDKTNNVPDYLPSYAKNQGITFRLISGDSLQLQNIKVILTSGGTSATFTHDLIRDRTSTVVDDTIIKIRTTDESDDATKQTYFAVPLGHDYTITAGETFTLLADGYYDNTLSTAPNKGKFLLWNPNGGKFEVKEFLPVTYTVFDTVSGKQIQTGSFTIR